MRRGLRERSWADTARRLRGPLYAVVDGGTAYQDGFGWSGDDVQVSLRHLRDGAELTVETSDHPPWDLEDSRLLVQDWAMAALQEHEPRFPLTLTADRWEQHVPVDGVPVPFVVVGGSGAWVAVGDVAGRQVGLSTGGWPAEGLALRSVEAAEVSPEVPDRR